MQRTRHGESFGAFLYIGSMSTLAHQPVEGKCVMCGAPFSASDASCLTCGAAFLAPNVRAARSPAEIEVLRRRCEAARKQATSNNAERTFDALLNAVEQHSAVVVAMPASVARTLITNTRDVYANYETLVGTKLRRAATQLDDTQRLSVAGILFGSFGNQIRYGVLSLTGEGLPTYGEVFCRLKGLTVADRVSFLECNSYSFVERNRLRPGLPVPAGFRSDWQNRHLLAGAKFGHALTGSMDADQLESLLVFSDGKDRQKDDFIEAHIYGGFTGYAIDAIATIQSRKLSPEAKVDIKILQARFAESKRSPT
jgi:hypothetical protein